MESFCKDLREHAMKIMNYKKKETISLTYEENELYEIQNVRYICKKIFSTYKNDKNVFIYIIFIYIIYHKVRHHWHYRGAI